MRAASVVMAGLAFSLVAGCAAQPMTRDRAARLCADEARAADGITGNIGVGGGSGGAAAGGRLVITSAIVDPRTEAEALQTCIDRRMAGGGAAPPRSGFTIAIEGSL